jgi:hypothetical protein
MNRKKQMSNISKLATKMNAVYAKYKLDHTDILMLGVLSDCWQESRDVRVTDMTLKFGKNFASPANIHYRLTKDLVKLQMVRLKTSKEDARVKFVVKGCKFDAMDKYLGGV